LSGPPFIAVLQEREPVAPQRFCLMAEIMGHPDKPGDDDQERDD
jgi:hypothetical protein